MAKQIMTTGNPLPKEDVPSEEVAQGLKRQELKNSESVG